MRQDGPTILLSAGEPSGDLHGAAVAAALRRRWPGARLFGLGGPLMAEAGVELLEDVRRLAVMGFVEVASRLPFFVRLLRRVRREMVRRGTDLVVPIDYPGFNLRLARAARRAGVPVLYYIAPQVWAWHRSRCRQLAANTDALAVVLPFEERIFREAGARAVFVGHPLLDAAPVAVTREAFCQRLGLDPGAPVLALFPGSRAQEVRRHLRVFEEAAQRVRETYPAVQPVIAASRTLPLELYGETPFPLVDDSRALLAHARAALVKSGTGTLEAALAGTPLVIAYRAHPLTFWLARRLVQVPRIGLVNLVAGETVAPEYLQDEATPEALARAVLPLVVDGEARQRMLEGLTRVRASLAPRADGAGSVADRVAQLAAELLAA
ncbi:MAG: lipid-A-disaccharide synthase [bacterium]|jgi:lipid-A-disaccharide synthase|nr:MAG: lipid-A-disaccharide synthase [bacterium]